MFYLSDESIFLFLLFCKTTDDIGPTTSSLLNILIAWNFHHHHQRRPLPEQNPVYITIILDGGILYIQIYSYKCKRKIIFCQIYNQTSEGVKKIHQEHAQYIYMKLEKKNTRKIQHTQQTIRIFPKNISHQMYLIYVCIYRWKTNSIPSFTLLHEILVIVECVTLYTTYTTCVHNNTKRHVRE